VVHPVHQSPKLKSKDNMCHIKGSGRVGPSMASSLGLVLFGSAERSSAVFPRSGASCACRQPTLGNTAAEIHLFLTDHQHTARGEVTFMEMRKTSGNSTKAEQTLWLLLSVCGCGCLCVCVCVCLWLH